jgi:hypothetical protein
MGYGHDTLAHDPEPFVRMAVARQGYRPEMMVEDEDPRVRLLASDHVFKAEHAEGEND